MLGNPDILAALQAEWEKPNGFLGQLRDLKFDPSEAETFIRLLSSISLDENQLVDKELVRLLWYVLPFVRNQMDSFERNRPDSNASVQLQWAYGRIEKELFSILGVP